ncbi:MAG: efflux RND transporter permease subunit, partial [Paramuribaculum sp.]|nr:efflux RND transporter permease subunit [Paramuribaculum sp.]
YQIQLDPQKLTYYDISINEVREATGNLNNNQSGGVVYDFGNEYMVKANLHSTTPSDLEKSVVATRNGMPVTIGDIAQVEIAAEQPRLGVASVKAKPAVLLTVTKQPAVGTIELTDKIDEALSDLSKTLPADVKISTDIFRQSNFISNSISNLQVSLFEGAIFVVIVLFFFLMNFRTTLISVVALPVSVILTVLILRWLNLSINTMTLGGIAIAIGSLVDDAIVDVENVYKRIRQNAALPKDERKSTLSVVYDASREVRLPILNSSLIIIASFLPLFFLTGIEGRMLVPLGLTFIIALVSSTIVALTLTPVLCSYLLGREKKVANESMKESWIVRHLSTAYAKSLAWAMRRRRAILVVTVILFMVATAGIFTLGRSFLPAFNEGSMTINVSTLPGVSLEESDKVGRLAEEIILATPEVQTVARKTGRAELDEHSLGVNVSEIEAPFVLKDRSRREMVRDLRERLSKIPGTNIEIGQPISHRIDAMLSGTEAQIAIKLFGTDID